MNFWQIMTVNGAIGILAQVLMFWIIEQNAISNGTDKLEAKNAITELQAITVQDMAERSSKSKKAAIFAILLTLIGIFLWEIALPFSYWAYSYDMDKLLKKTKDS